VSPGIFVDSHKLASESQKSKRIKIFCKYFDPFHPKFLRKDYVKKQILVNSANTDTPITSDVSGLCDYLTAVNIKHKIKHPIFFILKFPSCVSLYYNTKIFQNSVGYKSLESCILCRFQTILYRIQSQYSDSSVHSVFASGPTTGGTLNDKEFILVFQDSNEVNHSYFTKSIAEYIVPLKDDALHVTMKPLTIPEHFRSCSEVQIEKTYRALVPHLLKQKHKVKDDEESKPAQEKDALEPVKQNTNENFKVELTINSENFDESIKMEIMEEQKSTEISHSVSSGGSSPRPLSDLSAKQTVNETKFVVLLDKKSHIKKNQKSAVVATSKLPSFADVKKAAKTVKVPETVKIPQATDNIELNPTLSNPMSMLPSMPNMIQNMLSKQAEEQKQQKMLQALLPQQQSLQVNNNANNILQKLLATNAVDQFKPALNPTPSFNFQDNQMNLTNLQAKMEEIKQVEVLQRMLNQSISSVSTNQISVEQLLYSLLSMKATCENLKSTILRP
jgi:hypothetical protein